ncbi:MAG: tetratricopeptide repeat protein [Candidatus Hydrogenedentota bacterium]|jgi:Flp pilus assembly protein TadD|uniref:TPR repeat protein n=1 Tax=Sumerlaea chitinivorans TaxID=2250252 RepID=A0A2Z4Y3Z1_SUMC1|nr:TPR repeat protein [Candidatus Sumerlaea chitinivorans]RMH25761.1 MAG: tetratricopeptide repeat protein [Candidatus Hydrogenedentota bacterium]GIX44453.1 MAG: hypothetical protein KatS3mg130_0861 [Candidatus Sumerlaea sp.]
MPDGANGKEEQAQWKFATVEEYLEAGEARATAEELEQAVEILREAANRWPDNPQVHYELGVCIFMLLESRLAHLDLWENLAEDEALAEEAVSAFETAIALDPQMAEAYTNLGNLLALRGRVRKAIQLWEKSLELNPDQPAVRDNLTLYRAQLTEKDSGEGGQ